MIIKKLLILNCLILCVIGLGIAQDSYTISGYIRDAESGETLIGANIFVQENPVLGTSSNNYGYYSIQLKAGTHKLVYSYLGYEDQVIELELTAAQKLDVGLNLGGTVIDSVVVVTAEEADRNISRAEMGIIQLPMSDVKELPAFLGEVDLLRTMQLLPGVTSVTEGSTGFFVRGGGQDQNLVLLDEAVVYNSGHLLGFFSVFNSDAIKNTTIIKGGMPANYGGRLSSVLDIHMKEGNNKRASIEGGLGLVSSRLTIESPIVKEKSSFIVSGRRTYAYDLARPFLRGSDFEGTNYYFYDLNAKINHTFSDKDRVYLSGYFGQDELSFQSRFRDANVGVNYGNLTGTLRWNHLFNDRLFMNTSIIYNNYDYAFDGEEFGIEANINSGVEDWNFKIDFDYLATPHDLKFGVNVINHHLTPNITNFEDADTSIPIFGRSGDRYANEYAAYLLDRIRMNPILSLNIGLRASAYTLFGPYESKVTGESFDRNEAVTTYFGIEPRAIARLRISETASLKTSIAYSNQYIHMVTNSASSLPLEIWVPSTDLVQPQRGWQAAFGYFKNFRDNDFEFSVETYYKELNNQIDYAENYVNDPTQDLEDQFVFGDGKAYGLEFFLRKRNGKLNGWLSYTLSRTERTFDDINDGNIFPAIQDRPHDLSIAMSYKINPKWQISGSFVYTSGITFTPVESIYLLEQSVSYQFGDRNSARIEPYHRFDLSARLTPKQRKENGLRSSWTFSIYNLYDRRNLLFYYYVPQQNNETSTTSVDARKVSFFPIIPSITWNFKWQGKSDE